MQNRSVVVALFVVSVVGCGHVRAPLASVAPSASEFEAPLLALEASGTTVCALGFAQRVQCTRAESAHRVVRDVPGTEDAVTLALSPRRGCVTTGGGEVRCFGVHDGRTSAATPVLGVEDAQDVALSSDLSCARRYDGDVVCWSDAHPPTPVVGAGRAIAIAAIDHGACALDREGQVRCWNGSLEAQQVQGLAHAVAIASGESGTMALDRDGTLYELGQLGVALLLPAVPVARVADAVELSIGDDGGCVRRAEGEPLCWRGAPSQLRVDPTLRGASSIAVARGLACGLSGDRVRCDALPERAAL
jgi:hypothetical protein